VGEGNVESVPEDEVVQGSADAGGSGVRKSRPSFVRRSFNRKSMDGGQDAGGSFASSGGGEYDPPAAMEIIEYAKYLGMNPIYDADLLWTCMDCRRGFNGTLASRMDGARRL
jgi:hypothetical protein